MKIIIIQTHEHKALKRVLRPCPARRFGLFKRNNATSLYSCGSPGVLENATKPNLASSGTARNGFIHAVCGVVASSKAEPIGLPAEKSPPEHIQIAGRKCAAPATEFMQIRQDNDRPGESRAEGQKEGETGIQRLRRRAATCRRGKSLCAALVPCGLNFRIAFAIAAKGQAKAGAIG
jgi:hypothetical protein